MKTVLEFQSLKERGTKISMVTAYDFSSAHIVNATEVDSILVGDSCAMVMHGHATTLPATVPMMALHVAAVARGAPDKFIIADMPFLSFRKGLAAAMNTVARLMRAGAHAVKLEGCGGNENLIRHIVESGVPVMGHLGLTPQSIHSLGGMKVQAREQTAASVLLRDAQQLEAAGCFALVLECVPATLAKQVTNALHIPTIGIGAGPYTSGQVLVLQDMLGMNPEFKPKFLRTYLNGFELIRKALNTFHSDVKETTFPSEEESYP